MKKISQVSSFVGNLCPLVVLILIDLILVVSSSFLRLGRTGLAVMQQRLHGDTRERSIVKTSKPVRVHRRACIATAVAPSRFPVESALKSLRVSLSEKGVTN
jgi:hypothetical protein